MAQVNMICRDINGDRYYLCYDQERREAAWISADKLQEEEIKARFGVVSWESRELAEDRAKMIAGDIPALQEIKPYVITKNI